MDDRLTDAVSELKRLQRLASDHEWEGDTLRAEFLYKQAEYYKQIVDQGELYVPTF